MGKIDDPAAVLDGRLRVKGVKGLRVMDGEECIFKRIYFDVLKDFLVDKCFVFLASIMPYIVTSNTNAACIMIGNTCLHLRNFENRLMVNYMSIIRVINHACSYCTYLLLNGLKLGKITYLPLSNMLLKNQRQAPKLRHIISCRKISRIEIHF